MRSRMPRPRRLLLALLALSVLVGPGAHAQSLGTADQRPFRFDLKEVRNQRGPAVEGYLYNGLPWRIGDVRGRVKGEAYGWTLGDSPAGGRVFFTVPITERGEAYRASVDSFDKMSLENLQSP